MACGQPSSAANRSTINVMFLCDEWKSSKGGLSTFNREFAVNLAKTTTDRIKVHCYVSQSDELSREDARKHGVNLIIAQSVPGSVDPLDWLKLPPPELPNPDIVIGHGRKFGAPAYFIVQTAKCKWMHFVHVYCEDLGKFKATQSVAVDSIEENEKKHKSEIELCKAADVVVAVGSRLQQKYSSCLPHVKVEIITPGIFEKFLNESSQLVKDKLVKKKFSVFMFGRARFEDLTLKGYDIVANAIGSLEKMFELTFVGSSSGEYRKIEQWFLDAGISRSQLTIRGYCNEQEELTDMFREPDMVAIPSRTEGFGLVALEAISAGIPVLVAGETGIAEALREVEGGKSVIVESDYPEEWAQRIQQLSRQSPVQREYNAKLLRDNYTKTYSWSNQCERFNRMIQDLAERSNALKLTIDVEIMTPAEQNTQDRTTILAEESRGSHFGGHLETSAVPVSSGHARPSCKGTEVPQAPMSLIPTEGEVLRLIATNYLQTTPPRSKADHNEFLAHMQKMRVTITDVGIGSLLITVKCDSLEILETLWEDYSSGHLSEVVQSCFVTEEILTELSLAELKLQTTITEEEYRACKVYFEKDPARDREKMSSLCKSEEEDNSPSDEALEEVNNHIQEAFEILKNKTKKLRMEKEALDEAAKKLEHVHFSTMLKLNVGGHLFSTRLATLSKDPGSMLHAMFSGRFDTKPGKDGSYFIDRDGTHFRYILNYLRTGQLVVPEDKIVRKELLTEAEFYQIEGIINELKARPFKDSMILSSDHQQTLIKWTKETLTSANHNYVLLYRASRNGWAASNFHSFCDNKGPTVTVIKSGNYIFGGYTEHSWESGPGVYRKAPGSFLFSLVNPSGLPPTKLPLIAGKEGNAIYCNSGYGPTFGSGADFRVPSAPNSSNCYVSLNNTYQCPTGQNTATFFTGSQNFTIAEMEVFVFEK